MNIWSIFDADESTPSGMPWPELTVAFTTIMAQQPAPVLFASPHSGRCYPKAFIALSQLQPLALRASEDAWVDELFSGAPGTGANLMYAHFPRAMVDVNRDPRELDLDMYDQPMPPKRVHKNPRLVAGLGVIPRMVTSQAAIYAGRIAYAEAVQRLHYLHKPYHEALFGALFRQKQTFGSALLVDCHSMPSSSAGFCPGGRADFVLGDNHGRSCCSALGARVEHTLTAMGYKVVRNTPYSGGYSTVHYGKPEQGVEALQIEINRALYMDEKSLEKTDDFAALQKNLTALCKTICDLRTNNANQSGPWASACDS